MIAMRHNIVNKVRVVSVRMLPVQVLHRSNAHGQLKDHLETPQVAHSATQAQKRDAAPAIRGISSALQLQGIQSSARHVTGVKTTGTGKLMILVSMA